MPLTLTLSHRERGPNVPHLNVSKRAQHATPLLRTSSLSLWERVGVRGSRTYPTSRLVISNSVLTSCGRVLPLAESMMEL